MYRTTGLLVLKLSTDILFLINLNTNELVISYAFGASSIFLVCRNSVLRNRFAFPLTHLRPPGFRAAYLLCFQSRK